MDGKKLSNPFSTGNGGAAFENKIQTAFVTLMLSGGYAPCLPQGPIVGIKLQGAVDGYKTDDLIVFVEKPNENKPYKLLGQIKSSIKITKNNQVFAEVIQAAWSDFNNSDVFTKERDVIALITGPISKTDTDGVDGLLEHARHTDDCKEFITKVSRARFCSENVRNKLTAFKAQLKVVNNDKDVEEKELHEFLRHFHILGYDFAKKEGVALSLLKSHISQFNNNNPHPIWCQIEHEVRSFNQNAGTITLETLPKELVEYFKKSETSRISPDFAKENVEGDGEVGLATNWNHHPAAQKLAVATLIGSWNENNEVDIKVVTQIVGDNYTNWIEDLRETLQIHDRPLSYKNGLWRFKERLMSWQELGSRLFDNHLDTFKVVALEVLKVNDPSFELSGEERYAAAIHGKVLPHSDNLRKGLAESLALIGNRADSLTRCTQGKANTIAASLVHQLFKESDWIRWGSLNSMLPTLSEASPDEFLSAVENAISASPSPFDKLFDQEDTGVFGRNYITGLLWALEGIAWEEAYLSRTAVALAEIASHDPGGNWANRPSNSLTNIFLPWMPHTLASVEKRQATLKIICDEQPEVAWKLLESLLPNPHSTTSGTHKPNWRETIPESWEKGVTNIEYWEQSRFCAELIVEQAGFDVIRLTSLASNYNRLTCLASEELRNKLLSEQCLKLSEQERTPLWDALCKLIARHRRFPEAKWSLGNDSLIQIEEVASQLAPKSLNLLSKRLFSDAYFYEVDGSQQEKQKKLFQIRKTAIENILNEGGISQVLEFASTVSNTHIVGEVLGALDQSDFDADLLPALLDKTDQKIQSLVTAYVSRRQLMGNWQWFDGINKTDWMPKQIALLLCALPFEKNAWDKVEQLLGENEGYYWNNTNANTHKIKDGTEYALRKLLEFDRPIAAINGIYRDLSENRGINPDLACDALLAASVKSEKSFSEIDSYRVVEIIKALQKNAVTDQDKLFHIEWAYVTLFDWDSDGSPVTLENRLASDPSFFCERIQLIYRSEGEESNENPSPQQRNIATKAYNLLSRWKIVPGTQADGEFKSDTFKRWLSSIEEIVKASKHYDVAMIEVGKVLVNAPKGLEDLWIHPVIAEAMNSKERSVLRHGYSIGIYDYNYNSREFHVIDPKAKLEKALADKYQQQADQVENAGYQRLATTLRSVVDRYNQKAKQIISERSSLDQNTD